VSPADRERRPSCNLTSGWDIPVSDLRSSFYSRSRFRPNRRAADAAAQASILARITETALRAQEQLPDFICTQRTERSEDETGKGRRWKRRDTLETEFSFVGHRPSWKLLKLNGKPTHLDYGQLRTGFISDAILQFFSLPGSLFGAQAGTALDWNRWDALDGRRVAVFSLRVPESTSQLAFSNDEGRRIVGFHGLLYADPATAQVMRLEIQLDLPPDFPVQESTLDVDYGEVGIANHTFFLPVRAVAGARIEGHLARNETTVVRYQKYAADATVTFGDR
jgi:hypothetical protein